MKKQEIINKIGSLLTDKTAGILEKDKQLQGKDERFGSIITLKIGRAHV